MHTTVELLDLAKQRLALKHGLTLPMSDYRLGKLLNLKQATVSAWRTRSRTIGTEFVTTFADACDLSPEYVYACVQRERADNEIEISLLERIAAAFKETKAANWVIGGVVAMMAAGTFLASPENAGFASAFAFTPVCIMRLMEIALVLLALAAWRRRFFITIFPVATLSNGLIAEVA